MIDYNSFGVVGGDRRQIALAESIASDGYTVYAFGFDTVDFKKGVIKAELGEIAARCENIILPLPVTADGKYLNTQYSEKKTLLDDDFAEYMRNKTVFGGMMGKLFLTSELWDGIDAYDYYTREDFAVKNTFPTA